MNLFLNNSTHINCIFNYQSPDKIDWIYGSTCLNDYFIVSNETLQNINSIAIAKDAKCYKSSTLAGFNISEKAITRASPQPLCSSVKRRVNWKYCGIPNCVTNPPPLAWDHNIQHGGYSLHLTRLLFRNILFVPSFAYSLLQLSGAPESLPMCTRYSINWRRFLQRSKDTGQSGECYVSFWCSLFLRTRSWKMF